MSDTGRQSLTDKAGAALKVRSPNTFGVVVIIDDKVLFVARL